MGPDDDEFRVRGGQGLGAGAQGRAVRVATGGPDRHQHRAGAEALVRNPLFDQPHDALAGVEHADRQRNATVRQVECPAGLGAQVKDLVAAAPKAVKTIVVELDYVAEGLEMWDSIEKSYKFMTSSGLAEGNK